MLSTYVPQPTVVEADKRRINLDGLFRHMLECGHCPLRDYDFANLARTYGIGTGTMIALIRRNALDARLEDEHMATPGKLNTEKAMELYKQGMSDSKAAVVLGVTPPAFGAWRHKNNLPCNGVAFGKGPQPGAKIIEEESAKPPIIEIKPMTSIEQLADHVVDLERKAAVVNPDWEEAVGEMVASKPWAAEIITDSTGEVITEAGPVSDLRDIFGRIIPEIQPPSHDDLLAEIDRLECENNILRAVCFGAGVRGLDEWLVEALG